MNFRVIDNGNEVECDILLTFRDDNTGNSYIVYTDGTKNDLGKLEIYASRYKLKEGSYFLEAIENEYEWDLIDDKLFLEYKGNE